MAEDEHAKIALTGLGRASFGQNASPMPVWIEAIKILPGHSIILAIEPRIRPKDASSMA